MLKAYLKTMIFFRSKKPSFPLFCNWSFYIISIYAIAKKQAFLCENFLYLLIFFFFNYLDALGAQPQVCMYIYLNMYDCTVGWAEEIDNTFFTLYSEKLAGRTPQKNYLQVWVLNIY